MLWLQSGVFERFWGFEARQAQKKPAWTAGESCDQAPAHVLAAGQNLRYKLCIQHLTGEVSRSWMLSLT